MQYKLNTNATQMKAVGEISTAAFVAAHAIAKGIQNQQVRSSAEWKRLCLLRRVGEWLWPRPEAITG